MSDVKNFSRKLVPFSSRQFAQTKKDVNEACSIVKNNKTYMEQIQKPKQLDIKSYKFLQGFPYREGKWSWRWPLHVSGGLKHWFYYSWKYVNTNRGNKSMSSGLIILGFTKIDHIWLTTDRDEAIKIEQQNEKNFVKYMDELLNMAKGNLRRK